jgi:hypothetical protein
VAKQTVVAAQQPASLADLSTADLRAELARGLTMTAESLTRLGLIWAELESRGEDLSDLRSGMAYYLPLIAGRALAAEAVVAFASRPTLLKAMIGLSFDRQRAIAGGEPVHLVVMTDEGYDTKPVPAAALTAAQVRQVFGEGAERPASDQQGMIESRRAAAYVKAAGKPAVRGRVRADPKTGTLLVGRTRATKADVVAGLADLAGYSPAPSASEDEGLATAIVKLTEAEHVRLKQAALDGRTSQIELIRKALRAYGLI